MWEHINWLYCCHLVRLVHHLQVARLRGRIATDVDDALRGGIEDGKSELEFGNPDSASFYKLEMGHPDYSISLCGKTYNASDLSAMYLRELVREVGEASGQKIDKAVITVPAYFADPERTGTLRAGEQAGLNVLGIINEPTAAVIAYGLKKQDDMHNVLIYDLGGGTFDVTVARIEHEKITVIGSAGEHFLGGKNWDVAVTNWVAEQFEEEFDESFAGDKETFNACMVKSEKAKRQLSNAPYADISIEYEGHTGKYRLTNELFKECTIDLLDITKNTINNLFEDIGMSWAQIDGVILVGGSTKMRMVSEYIVEMTGKPPLHGVHPDEAVAIGAALHAASIDVQSSPRRIIGELFGRTEEKKIEIPGLMEFEDVMPHSMGMISISADGRRFVNDVMIKRNTPLKDAYVHKIRELNVSRREEYNEMEIYLLQGDAECPLDCTIAKKYVFDKIAYVDGGVTKMDICYYYTKNGTIAIEAVQTETGKQLKYREEPIPEDMSWVMMDPDEYFKSTVKTVPVEGCIYMALDVSGSMMGEPMQLAKQAMLNFTRQFAEKDVKIGIIAFADRVQVLQEATSNQRKIETAISQLRVGLGGGNDAEPMTDMLRLMKKFRGDPFVYALILTDGQWCSSPCNTCRRLKPAFVKEGFEVIGLGFGTADEGFLRDISTRTDFASVEDINQLDAKLSEIGCGKIATLYPAASSTRQITAGANEGWSTYASPLTNRKSSWLQPRSCISSRHTGKNF